MQNISSYTTTNQNKNLQSINDSSNFTTCDSSFALNTQQHQHQHQQHRHHHQQKALIKMINERILLDENNQFASSNESHYYNQTSNSTIQSLTNGQSHKEDSSFQQYSQQQILFNTQRCLNHQFNPESPLSLTHSHIHSHQQKLDEEKRKKFFLRTGNIKMCSNCGTTSTPSWRRCPEGKNLLCNACGLYHKLHHKARPFIVSDDGSVKVQRNSPNDLTTCSNCGTIETPLWRRGYSGECLCNACGLYQKQHQKYRNSKRQPEFFHNSNNSNNHSDDIDIDEPCTMTDFHKPPNNHPIVIITPDNNSPPYKQHKEIPQLVIADSKMTGVTNSLVSPSEIELTNYPLTINNGHTENATLQFKPLLTATNTMTGIECTLESLANELCSNSTNKIAQNGSILSNSQSQSLADESELILRLQTLENAASILLSECDK